MSLTAKAAKSAKDENKAIGEWLVRFCYRPRDDQELRNKEGANGT
jgi:hypothetical protein